MAPPCACSCSGNVHVYVDPDGQAIEPRMVKVADERISVQPQDIEDRVSQDIRDRGRVLAEWLLG